MSVDGAIYHNFFINNTISAIIRGFADWVGNELFDRTQEIVIATYEKGVQHHSQRMKDTGGEKLAPKFPYVVIDPQLDFEPDPQMGRFFHGYPNFMGGFASDMYLPVIYDDGNVRISPILNRYKGQMDVIVWCSSVYDLIDKRMMAYQIFGGQDRIIYPKNIRGNIILPNEILTYTYENPYNGLNYTLDWESSDNQIILVKNINQDRWCFPFSIRPWLKMTSCNDGSTKYGGRSDALGDQRLMISLEWECHIPTHLALMTNKRPTWEDVENPFYTHNVKLQADISVGYEYSVVVPYVDDAGEDAETAVPYPEHKIVLLAGDSTNGELLNDAHVITEENLTYSTRYSYTITEEDYAAYHTEPATITTITLPEPCAAQHHLKLVGKYGELIPRYHWRLADENTVEMLGFNLDLLNAGDTIWILYYINEGTDGSFVDA